MHLCCIGMTVCGSAEAQLNVLLVRDAVTCWVMVSPFSGAAGEVLLSMQ